MTLTPFGGLEGLLLVDGPLHPDERGVFFESFRADEWARAGLPPLVQDNLSRSRRGVLRGLHYQAAPAEIGKLVRCVRGRVFDAVVDIRRGSPTFGRHAALELDDSANRMLWIPPGFAHGFCALSPDAVVSYKVTGYWSKAVDRGLLWNDPALGIAWPLRPGSAIVSAKDAALPLLAELVTETG